MRAAATRAAWTIAVAALLPGGVAGVRGQALPAPAGAGSGEPAYRVALVPADDRPVNLQDVVLAARTADVELVTPPRSRLGGRDIEGDADGIADWLDGLDPDSVGAVVVSLDMLAYGGAEAARQPETVQSKALQRLDAIRRLAARKQGLPILAYGTLLPLAPAPEPKRAEVLGKLERWASLAGTRDPDQASERDRLKEALPSLVLTPYLAVRARDRAVTLAALDLASRGVVSYLVLEARETAPRGLSLEERNEVEQVRAAPDLEGRTALVAATDGMSALLVARAVNGMLRREPGVEAAGEGTEALAGIAGAHRVGRAGAGDLVVQVVSVSNEGASADAANAAGSRVKAGARVAVADITGGAQSPGSSIPLVEALRSAHLFPRLVAYAAEGAADPTIAAAVSQGLLASAGLDAPSKDGAARARMAAARSLAMLHRVVVDFLYQAVVRPQALSGYAPEHRMDPDDLDADQVLRMQEYLTGEVKPLAESLVGDFAASAPRARHPAASAPIKDIDGFRLTLPWRRLSDPEIRFTIVER